MMAEIPLQVQRTSKIAHRVLQTGQSMDYYMLQGQLHIILPRSSQIIEVKFKAFCKNRGCS
jgi:hypothetical protein